MKKIVGAFLLVSMIAVSCNKVANVYSIATWSIGTHGYAASSVNIQSGNQILASDTLNTMHVFFSVLPTTSGTYTVVSMNKALSQTLGANEMAVQYTVGRTDTFSSIGAGSGVNVVLTARLISFVLPVVSVQHRSGTTIIDTTTAGGTVEQH